MKYLHLLFLFLIFFGKVYCSPFAVDQGGTGISQAIVAGVLCGGVSSEGPLQFVSGYGTSGQGLVSAGVAAPVWQNVYPGRTATDFVYAGASTTGGNSPSRTVLFKPTVYSSLSNAAVDNTAFGYNCSALLQSSMIRNTMIGARNFSLSSATAGSSNTAIGSSNSELNSASIGANHTQIGANTFKSGSKSGSSAETTLIGDNNGVSATAGRTVAVGLHALFSLTSGTTYTALGSEALNTATTGSSCCAMGYRASFSQGAGLTGNVAIGANALSSSTASNNTAIGSSAGSTATSGGLNLYIGYNVVPISVGETSNTIIGNSSSATAYLFGIYGQTTVNAATNILINGSSQLGMIVSSKKYKENIMSVSDETIAKLLKLDVVKFNYISDETKELHYGMIAQDVVNIFPEAVVYDANGEIYSIQYHKFTPLLVKQVQNQHEKIKSLKKRSKELIHNLAKLRAIKG